MSFYSRKWLERYLDAVLATRRLSGKGTATKEPQKKARNLVLRSHY